MPTTAGCIAFQYMPTEDATVVARLRQAGALIFGKTNLDQFATGLVGVRSPYGIPRNSLNPELVPGGSSSGSAVAVAAGEEVTMSIHCITPRKIAEAVPIFSLSLHYLSSAEITQEMVQS